MHLFADLNIGLGAIAAWVVAGLVAGWLAGKVIGDPTYGLAAELFAGVAGAVGGGLLFGLVMPDRQDFYVGVLLAFVSACVVIAAARLVARRTSSD